MLLFPMSTKERLQQDTVKSDPEINSEDPQQNKTATVVERQRRYPLIRAHYYGYPCVFGFPLPWSYVTKIGREVAPPLPDNPSEEDLEWDEVLRVRNARLHWIDRCQRLAPRWKVQLPY
ncbi:hypothetical protein VKT23_019616 [Stygiomarasmius scandens]|uniref:Uncharacterized protein n=1 Tax=Marasmiellus scandens TaxID=2682957 RepID=A0ABR1IP56_9AGAR